MAIDPKVFKQVRKALGLSQQELADALGLSRVTVNKMERGKLRRGIPDEVADHLLALRENHVWAKLTPEEMAKISPAITVEGAVTGRWTAPKDDSHLWDNEEDDQ